MLANSDTWFGIINHQQPVAFNHHPWHLALPPWHHHHPQQPLPLTTAINCLQPWHTTNNGTTNSDVAMPHHEPQQPPAQPQTMKNTQKWTQRTPPLTNDSQHPWMDTSKMSQGETAHLPPFNPLIWNPGATSPSASSFVVVVRAPQWVPPSLHPNPPCSHTAQWWTNNMGQQQCE